MAGPAKTTNSLSNHVGAEPVIRLCDFNCTIQLLAICVGFRTVVPCDNKDDRSPLFLITGVSRDQSQPIVEPIGFGAIAVGGAVRRKDQDVETSLAAQEEVVGRVE